MHNWYEILEISKDASLAEIKQGYRRAVQKYHPDKNKGDKNATEKFLLCKKALEVLTSEYKRKAFEEQLNKQEDSFTEEVELKYEDIDVEVFADIQEIIQGFVCILRYQVMVDCLCSVQTGCALCKGTHRRKARAVERIQVPALWDIEKKIVLAQKGHRTSEGILSGDVSLRIRLAPKHGWFWSEPDKAMVMKKSVSFATLQKNKTIEIMLPTGNYWVLPTNEIPRESAAVELESGRAIGVFSLRCILKIDVKPRLRFPLDFFQTV